MALILETESCRYSYTQPELLELGRKMARSRDKLDELEGELDTFKAQHKFKVQAAEEEEGLNRSRFMAGYEMRPTAMMVLKYRPDADHALVIRLDTGRVHENRKLTDKEKQLTLSTDKPPVFIFTADFYWQGSDEVAEMCAEGVPLTKVESDKVREFTTLKPMRKMLAAKAGK